MNSWLLEISLGPVQGFIAAARRSRDLWAGSYILSELVRAAAAKMIDQRAELIYPLAPRVQRENPQQDSNLSNILLARIDGVDEEAVRAIASAVKQAARDRLASFADTAMRDWQGAGVALRNDLWKSQVADAIEAYAAWAAIPAVGEGGRPAYRVAYDNLKQALAARKNTRDFAPMFATDAADKGAGVPKCSFDGLRESVLPNERQQFPPRFGLSRGEQLDALGCIKRVVGRTERFTALSRFAADGWLKKLDAEKRRELAGAYERLVSDDVALATRSSGSGGAGVFPYDGGLLFSERYDIAARDCQGNAAAITALADLGKVLRPLWKRYGRPCPYGVLLIADGDRMGRFVDQSQSAADHQRVSDAVAAFADRVPQLARDFGGQCVFAGGEDLTVFLPLAAVVDSAFALHEAFTTAMAAVVADLARDDADARPTLRVGAAICHVLEPLGVIRQRAAAAEKFAKGEAGSPAQGNALGLKLHIRSGHEIGLRLRFDDAAGRAALAAWQAAYTQRHLPGRLAYDTRAIALHCRATGASTGVAAGEFRRLLDRARQGGGAEKIDDELRKQLDERRAALAGDAAATAADATADAAHRADATGLQRLADELILARWLSAATADEVSAAEGAQ